jgi:hypothetical protein
VIDLDERLARAFLGTGVKYEVLNMPDDSSRNWWAKPQRPQDIDTYVIHHSAGAAHGSPQQIYNQHYKQWGGVGYHFMVHCYTSNLGVVRKVYRTRDPLTWGAHVAGKNDHKLGVCWLGSYHIDSPDNQALRAGREIFTNVRKVFNSWCGRENNFVGHKDLAPTACPGGEWVKPFLQAINTQSQDCEAAREEGYNQAILDVQRVLDELELV